MSGLIFELQVAMALENENGNKLVARLHDRSINLIKQLQFDLAAEKHKSDSVAIENTELKEKLAEQERQEPALYQFRMRAEWVPDGWAAGLIAQNNRMTTIKKPLMNSGFTKLESFTLAPRPLS